MKAVTEAGVLALLKENRSFVLTAHVSPDGDCLGSMLALYEFLVRQGKHVIVLLDDVVPSVYRMLPYWDVIRTADDVGRIKADLLVVLDASTADRIGRVGEIVQAPTLNIDHHVSNKGFTDHRWLDADAAATGELIYRLLEEAKEPITKEMATNLYTAIATDCGFFRYANTRPATMRIGADLLSHGVEPNVIAEALEEVSLSTMHLTVRALQTMAFYAEGKIAVITVTRDMLEHDESTDELINYPRKVEGVEVAVMLKQKDDTSVKISMRSRSVDVSQIAMQFGGGGHARAAGCSIEGSIDEAREKLLAVIAAKVGSR
ncbi:MAG: bifunctional oligoribonuclease/PAP phosphatase NrnA [Selenomonadales bacterium]|nr:bifunctional oligoribonuclease/PAP phosphatase NrnA [Selenomonadales bacterium]